MYDILQLKSDMEGALHGTTLNQIANLDGLLDRAARDVLADCDPNETMRFTPPVPLYTGVYSYSCPSDLKSNRIFDIRPQVNRQPWQGSSQTFSKPFDMLKDRCISGSFFNVKWDKSIKSLEIAVNQQAVTILNSCDAFNGNGTWVAGTNVSQIATDNLNFVQGSGSVRFDLADDGYIENSTMSAIDMTTLNPEGKLYLWVWMPSGAGFTSVELRWGSSASNYWSATSVLAQDGTAFQNGWNLLSFDWPTSATGTPNQASVTYLRVSFVITAIQNPVRIDGITSWRSIPSRTSAYSAAVSLSPRFSFIKPI